jgi:hypothetical protein
MNKQEIEIYFNNQQVIDQLLRQLEKDLELEPNCLFCNSSEANVFYSIFKLLLPFVEKNIHQDYGKFMNTLYRIDVSEQKIKQSMLDKSSTEFPSVMTELILQKEMQKIIIRLVYANRNNSSN